MTIRGALLLFLGGILALPISAIEGWLVDQGGHPVVSARVGIHGVSGWFPTDDDGRFDFPWDPDPPFVLVVVGENDERFVPVAVSQIPDGIWTIEVQRFYAEEITVAAAEASNVTSSPASVSSVVTREETERTAPQNLAEAIRDVPGTTIVGEGPAAVPAIRGLAKSRTLILIDEGRVMTERRAGPSATFIDPFDLEAVELTRGPGSVAYGSDAMGGVIHLRTRLPEDVSSPRTRVRLGTELGAQAAKSASAETLWPALGGTTLFRARYRSLDDYDAPSGERILDSSFRDVGGALRWGGQTRAGRLRLGLTFDEANDIGRPSVSSDAQRVFYATEVSRRLTASLQPTHSTVEFHASIGTYRLVLDRETPRDGTPQTLERSDVESTDVTLRTQSSRVFGRGFVVTGADFSGRFGLTALTIDEARATDSAPRRTTHRTIDDADKTDLGVFTTIAFPVRHAVLLSAGLRTDWVRSENRTEGNEGSESKVAPSGHIAVTTGPWRGLTTTLQLSSGFREPSLSDRYFTGPTARGSINGNPDLDPERSYQADGTIQWNVGRKSFSLSAYDYDIRDLIERFRDGNDFFFRNRGTATIRGIELEAEFPWRDGRIRVSGATARGKADDASNLDDVPGMAVNLAIDRRVGPAELGLRARHVFEDDRPGPTEASRDSYTAIDASIGFRLRNGLALRITPRNIFDETYHRAADDSAPVAPGRSVAIQLSASWDWR